MNFSYFERNSDEASQANLTAKTNVPMPTMAYPALQMATLRMPGSSVARKPNTQYPVMANSAVARMTRHTLVLFMIAPLLHIKAMNVLPQCESAPVGTYAPDGWVNTPELPLERCPGHPQPLFYSRIAIYFFFASSFSIAATTSGESGCTFGAKRATTLPSRLKRNFSKFQVIFPGNFGSVSFDVSCL